MNQIIQILATRIKERGTTYVFLANQIGISGDLFGKIMKGSRRLRADEFIALCRILDLSLDDFHMYAGRDATAAAEEV